MTWDEFEALMDGLSEAYYAADKCWDKVEGPAKCVGAPFSLGTAVRLELARSHARAAVQLIEGVMEEVSDSDWVRERR